MPRQSLQRVPCTGPPGWGAPSPASRHPPSFHKPNAPLNLAPRCGQETSLPSTPRCPRAADVCACVHLHAGVPGLPHPGVPAAFTWDRTRKPSLPPHCTSQSRSGGTGWSGLGCGPTSGTLGPGAHSGSVSLGVLRSGPLPPACPAFWPVTPTWLLPWTLLVQRTALAPRVPPPHGQHGALGWASARLPTRTAEVGWAVSSLCPAAPAAPSWKRGFVLVAPPKARLPCPDALTAIGHSDVESGDS